MSMKDLFATIVGQESLSADDLSKAEEKVVVLTAEEAAEAVADAQLAEAEKNVAVHTACVEKHDSAIDILEEKVEKLEEAVDGMEHMRSGATPFNPELFAHHYNTAVKVGNSFGMKLERQGAESFGTKESTELVILDGNEALKDVAVKALQQAKEWLIEMWNSAIAAIGSLGNAYKAVGSQATALKAKVTTESVAEGDVTLPADAFLLGNDGESDYNNVATRAVKDFVDYLPSEKSFGMISKEVGSGTFPHASIEVNSENATISVSKKDNAPTQAKALGADGVKKLLDKIISTVAASGNGISGVKDLQTARDKSIASMGSNGKEDIFAEQKKWGRLSSKLVLASLALNGRILKAQLALAKANLK